MALVTRSMPEGLDDESIGIITLEDVIEELLMEEIEDEADYENNPKDDRVRMFKK